MLLFRKATDGREFYVQEGTTNGCELYERTDTNAAELQVPSTSGTGFRYAYLKVDAKEMSGDSEPSSGFRCGQGRH